MNTLTHLRPEQVVITNEQAERVLRYFFPYQPIAPSAVTEDDRAFAESLLIEAVDASSKMSYVEELFNNAFMKAPVDYSFVEEIVKSLGKRAMGNWFRHATGEDLKNPRIYEMVRSQISRSFISVWTIRLQTGELTY